MPARRRSKRPAPCHVKSKSQCKTKACSFSTTYGCVSKSQVDFPPKALGGGVLELRRLARKYVSDNRIRVPAYCFERSRWAKLDVDRAMRIAEWFDARPAQSPVVSKSVAKGYETLKKEVLAQYEMATEAGYKVEPWLDKGQPYDNSEGLVADVRQNKHMYIFLTEAGFGSKNAKAKHPLLERTKIQYAPGKYYVYNDLFRFVHDLFGHAMNGYSFGARGEENAWASHRCMFSAPAARIMSAETRAQNSWVNFGPHMRDSKGKLLTKGDPGYVGPAQRPYADQKIMAMPARFMQF